VQESWYRCTMRSSHTHNKRNEWRRWWNVCCFRCRTCRTV